MSTFLKNNSKKVIYLVGLPGVGKTTVGTVIAKKTGFILFGMSKTADIPPAIAAHDPE